jgi:hypothetical protein
MISPGELSVGQYVTVLENKPFETFSEDLLGTVQTATTIDRSGMGEVLLVIAINLPYIVVERCSNLNSINTRRSIDTRRSILMELSKEYIEALNNKSYI